MNSDPTIIGLPKECLVTILSFLPYREIDILRNIRLFNNIISTNYFWLQRLEEIDTDVEHDQLINASPSILQELCFLFESSFTFAANFQHLLVYLANNKLVYKSPEEQKVKTSFKVYFQYIDVNGKILLEQFCPKREYYGMNKSRKIIGDLILTNNPKFYLKMLLQCKDKYKDDYRYQSDANKLLIELIRYGEIKSYRKLTHTWPDYIFQHDIADVIKASIGVENNEKMLLVVLSDLLKYKRKYVVYDFTSESKSYRNILFEELTKLKMVNTNFLIRNDKTGEVKFVTN